MTVCAAAVLAVALPTLAATGALEAKHRAAGAADAAALAAADAAIGWVSADPCALAVEITEAAQVTLEGCHIDHQNGQAHIEVSVRTVFGAVHTDARAGQLVSYSVAPDSHFRSTCCGASG